MFFINGFFILTISVVWRYKKEFNKEYNKEFSIFLDFIFSKNIEFLYLLHFCCFFFYYFLSFPLILGAPFKANSLTDTPHFDRLNHSTNCWSFLNFSATAMTCSQIFVLLLMQLLSHLKFLPFSEETQKCGLQTQQ